MTEKNKINLTIQDVNDISPYDASYPVMFLSNGIKNELERAQIVAQSIYQTVVREMPILTQIHQSMDKGFRYVVDASESTLKAIENGMLKLTQENGKTYVRRC